MKSPQANTVAGSNNKKVASSIKQAVLHVSLTQS